MFWCSSILHLHDLYVDINQEWILKHYRYADIKYCYFSFHRGKNSFLLNELFYALFSLKMFEESLIRVLKLDSWCHQLDTCMVHTHKYVNRINIRDLSEKIDSQQKKTFNRWIFSLLASFLQIDKKEWENKFYLWKPTMESNCRIHAKTIICWYRVSHFVNLSILERNKS